MQDLAEVSEALAEEQAQADRHIMGPRGLSNLAFHHEGVRMFQGDVQMKLS